MRHRVGGYKLGRNPPHRKAMFRNLATALITHERITTTVPKAKAVRPMVEKMVTLAREANAARQGGGNDVTHRRRLARELGGNRILVDRDLTDSTRAELRSEGYRVNKYHELQRGPKVVNKLIEDIAPRYEDRPGGYTRIVRLGKYRKGDGGELCVLMFVGDESGPQLTGQHSRRREKANRRAERAAQLRRGGAAAPAAGEAVDEALEPVSEDLEPLEPIEAETEESLEPDTEESLEPDQPEQGDTDSEAKDQAPDEGEPPSEDEPRRDNPGT